MKEKMIRRGLAWVLTRYCDRPICLKWKEFRSGGTKGETGALVDAKAGGAVGV